MPEKRTLSLPDLHSGIEEAESLLNSGYESAGIWNLSQCCGHLNHWLSFPIDGFPKTNPIIGAMLWMMKKTIGKKQLATILESGFKPGTPTMPQSVPKPDEIADREAVEQLKATVERFIAHTGPIHASPLFGEMDKELANKLQLRHFEHHLGFLSPKS